MGRAESTRLRVKRQSSVVSDLVGLGGPNFGGDLARILSRCKRYLCVPPLMCINLIFFLVCKDSCICVAILLSLMRRMVAVSSARIRGHERGGCSASSDVSVHGFRFVFGGAWEPPPMVNTSLPRSDTVSTCQRGGAASQTRLRSRPCPWP